MEKYQKPICEIIVLGQKDIITTSDDIVINDGDNGNGWTDEAP